MNHRERAYNLKSCGLLFLILFFAGTTLSAQVAPAIEENIPFLVTFGKDAEITWGDDDFLQIFFCLVPFDQKEQFYIRVYDPDIGGDYDEIRGSFNTTTRFSVYAGQGCWSDTAAQSIKPTGNYKSGYLLSSKTFGADPAYDKKYYSFGPFNPQEGEYAEKFGGRVFKIIAEGLSGDDGNLYRYQLSNSAEKNIDIEGGNFFTYKYHFRLHDDQKKISQIYPYADDKTISIEVSNFDWDNDGLIRIFSVAKNGLLCDVSNEGDWIVKRFPIVEEEKNSTLEIQFIKSQVSRIINNNVVVSIRNQYGISLPFFVIPIGGVPVYSPNIRMK